MRVSGWLGLTAALILSLASCSMKNVQDEPVDAGESQTFDAPYAAVTQAATEGILRVRLEITHVEEEPDRLVILFVRPTSNLQWGAAGRLVVDKSAAPPTVAHVTYDRRLPLSGGGQERWARAIFAKMRDALRTADSAR